MTKLTIIFLIILFAISAFSQTADLASFLKTETGGRIAGYFLAFNSGDESLKAFFQENISAESLKQRPVEPRVAFHRQVRNDFQKIEISKLISATDSEVKLIAKSSNGSLVNYSFNIDPATKKINGLGIEPVEGGEPASPLNYPPPVSMVEFTATSEKMFSELNRDGKFSGVVYVEKNGKPVLTKAFGHADQAGKTGNNTDTKFNLGSINKTFTRIAIGQLIKQGKLKWTDKLISVLPDYPNRDAAAKITIAQLVTMTSGIGDFATEKFWSMDRSALRDNKDFLRLFASNPLLFEPGTSKRYSNGGYVVLGLVIEKIGGTSYYDYVRENVFKVAGMSDTDSFFKDKFPANTAVGFTTFHQKTPGLGTNLHILPGRGSAAGGGYSTVGDMVKFAEALRAKKLEIIDDDGTFPVEFNALGIAGGSEGVNAMFVTNASRGFTVIVLSNLDEPSAERPGEKLLEWLRQIR
jgi:CubicO group peptidase (beta-lactamase class C family)